MELSVRNIPEMYSEMMVLMKGRGMEEDSRNGKVLSLRTPLTVTVWNPANRVLHDRVRCANPFFHVMEFVWMMSGSNKPEWVSQFNSRLMEYADAGTGTIHGAYGHRWRAHFSRDQIASVISMLRKDPQDRRVVLGMWDPRVDLTTLKNDLPCNTHIYFRVVESRVGGGQLDMTVCNRSNDVVWGMTGANAVHMTLLQELVSQAAGIPMGAYRVFTNNAHIYTGLRGYHKMLDTLVRHDRYDPAGAVPVLGFGDNYIDFLDQCGDFVSGGYSFRNNWLKVVALPMREYYLSRRAGRPLEYWVDSIKDVNWRVACEEWIKWKS
jgi:thymidylate synthase